MTQDNDDLERRAMQALDTLFDQPSGEREAWARETYSDDQELLTRVLRLLAAESESVGSLRTGGAQQLLEDEFHPERAGAYKITSLIGRGGMGAVYTGERDAGDFDHQVAIKVIRPGILSETLIERFETERQILAKLNHTGIARLFDGGTLPDGSPYMVMEYVDGTPVTEWIDQKGLSLDDRLWIFSDICAAVEYAHQNLVIHRDITPSNVLIDANGAVKLIDFGIAKPQAMEDSLAPVEPGSLASLSFTPGFAAPERGRGAPANTLSDIYSLGKLLEAMLDNAAKVADLKAIIERASSENPEHRYPSVSALSEDVRNYRTGYPVEAREGGGLYTLRKYLGRRRYVVAFSALAVAALVTALGVTLIQYQRAEAALVHANDRFEQARGLSRSMITDVYTAIEQVPGTLEARENMAGIVRAYVDELAADPNAPDNVLMDIAVQNTRLSDVYGGLGIANLGDTETSWALLLDAEKALSQLLERNPDDLEAIDEMAWVKRLKSNQQLSYQLDVEGARKTNQEGLALAARAMTLPGWEDTRIYFRFWNARTDHIKILTYENATEAAVEAARLYQKELSESTYDEEPQRRNSRLAYFSRQEGEALADLERWEEAIPPLRAAIASYDQILEVDPSRYYYQLQKLTTIGPLTLAEINTDRGEDAMASAAEGLALARDLLATDETDAASRGYVAAKLEMQARAQAKFGDQIAGKAAIEEAISLRRGLIADFPDTPSHDRDLAGTLIASGRVYQSAGETVRACQDLNESLAILQALAGSETLTTFEQEVWMPTIRDLMQSYGCGAPS